MYKLDKEARWKTVLFLRLIFCENLTIFRLCDMINDRKRQWLKGVRQVMMNTMVYGSAVCTCCDPGQVGSFVSVSVFSIS